METERFINTETLCTYWLITDSHEATFVRLKCVSVHSSHCCQQSVSNRRATGLSLPYCPLTQGSWGDLKGNISAPPPPIFITHTLLVSSHFTINRRGRSPGMDRDAGNVQNSYAARTKKLRSNCIGVSLVLCDMWHTSTEYPAILILIWFSVFIWVSSLAMRARAHAHEYPSQSPNDPFLSHHICLSFSMFLEHVCQTLCHFSHPNFSVSAHVHTLMY